MLREHAIQLAGKVVKRLSGKAFQVELANGHRLVAFVRRRDLAAAQNVAAGERVIVEVSACDFSAGRLQVDAATSRPEDTGLDRREVNL